jgi:alpha-galactosidase
MITFRDPPVPGQLSQSGLTMVEESLVRGRFFPRCWSSTGFIANHLWPVHGGVPMEQNMPDIGALPAEAFDLEMDGQSLQGGWEWHGAAASPPGPREQDNGVLRLRSSIRPVEIALRTASDATGFLVRHMEITNTGDRPAALARVAPWAGILWGAPWEGPRPVTRDFIGEGASPFSLGRCTEEEWAREGAFRWQAISHGVTRIEHTKGSSGNDDPSVILRNEITGELAVICLAWSGNWAISVRASIPDSAHAWLSFRVEPLGDAPLRVVAPGETITTPAVHLGLFRGDLDTAVQALHAHERCSVLPPQPEGLGERVIYNHWGYGEWQMTPAYLEAEMGLAAEVGAELFVVDAGWFSPLATDWAHSVGTWKPHAERFPEGFLPTVAKAHDKGLLIGLWVEAERVAAGSWVPTEHPDWVLRRDGKELGIAGTEPGGLLDLANPDCAKWLEGEIERVVTEYGLDMFRLDYNAYPGRGGQHSVAGFVESELWRHCEAVYGIFDRLRARHPRLILENCAGGGARKDLGIAARFHTFWTSDWQSVPRTLQVLNGVSMFLPPERMNRLAGAAMQSQFFGDLDTQLRVPLFGHYALSGLTPDRAVWNPMQKDRVRHYISIYRDFVRSWLPACRVYHHTPVLAGYAEPRGWCVLEYAAPDMSRGLAGIFRLAGEAPDTWRFKARGLDRGARYRVTWDGSGQAADIEGWRLAEQGLEVRRSMPLTSELLLFERIAEDRRG